MATYKTPDVYVEEISLFPPSVAQVETAIPAFIGYTAKATEYASDDLLNVPKRIGSMLEFELYFGGAPAIDVGTLELNAQNQVSLLTLEDQYYLYESMRLFFSNGGGDCYIVAVGKYGQTIQNGNGTTTPGFLLGLEAIKKMDEPTLLVIPDAGLMNQDDMSDLQKQMLAQCAELQDRFCIFDLHMPGPGAAADFQGTVDDFRTKIGMNNLKYGAVYGPALKVNQPRIVRYSDFKGKITQNGSTMDLFELVDSTVVSLANRLDGLVDDNQYIADQLALIHTTSVSMQSKYDELVAVIKNMDTGATSAAQARTKLTPMLNFFVDTAKFLLNTVNNPDLNDTGAGSLVAFLTAQLGTSLTDMKDSVIRLVTDFDDTNGAGGSYGALTAPLTPYPAVGAQVYFTGADAVPVKIKNAISGYNSIWALMRSQLDTMVSAASTYLSTVETSAVDAMPVLKNIMQAISGTYLTLPASGAVAGAYATVDRTRGVWKAPANLSLNNVVGLIHLIDNKEQENLNVDTVAGKSVNAIRPFTGKGILIWGARTLAGNDNEWRYVSVRRFFNMVEESTKKASYQFVFEANDANTWVRLRGMIENFLTQQWKAGALAGAKPEQAFYVKVGLGQTMSAQDILEGRMNVEIGLAVVRPAEFIILKFSHKMQEA